MEELGGAKGFNVLPRPPSPKRLYKGSAVCKSFKTNAGLLVQCLRILPFQQVRFLTTVFATGPSPNLSRRNHPSSELGNATPSARSSETSILNRVQNSEILSRGRLRSSLKNWPRNSPRLSKDVRPVISSSARSNLLIPANGCSRSQDIGFTSLRISCFHLRLMC